MNEQKVRVLDLFSGIGGFSAAAEIANALADADERSEQRSQSRSNQRAVSPGNGSRFISLAHAEVNPFACAVYHRHFPDSVCFGGVENVSRDSLLERCGVLPDVVCGGFPCQPHSCAGKRLASADERDLWGECRRILGDVRPRFALFENVSGLLTSESGLFFNRVLSDLAALRYACQWQVVPASAVGAPHRRDRIWMLCWDELADSAQGGRGELRESSWRRGQPDGGGEVLADADQAGRGELRGAKPVQQEQRPAECGCLAWPALSGHWPSRPGEPQHGWEPKRTVEPSLGVCADGLPAAVGGTWPEVHNRVSQLKAAGNAIVPEVAAAFMLAILRRFQ